MVLLVHVMRQLGHQERSKRRRVIIAEPLPCRQPFVQPDVRRYHQRRVRALQRDLFTHRYRNDRVLRRSVPEQQPALLQPHQQSIPRYAELFSVPSDRNQDDSIHASPGDPQARQAEIDNAGRTAVGVDASTQLDQADGAADQEPVSTGAKSYSAGGVRFIFY